MDEDIQEILKTFPIWDDSVWEPLQKKQYETAEQNLESVFENISLDDWTLVHWQGIFGGLPVLLGDITEEEWRAMVRPVIVKAAIAAASGKGMSIIIQNLEPAEQLEFVNLFIKNISGATSEEKLNWLKEHRPSLYMLAISAPGQELGMNPVRYSSNFSENILIKKFKILPKSLKDSLFFYESAEIIFRAGRNNHLSDEKITLLARTTGRILMGFIHPEDFQKEIETGLSIDNRIAGTLAGEIYGRILSAYMADIRDVYEPINMEKEIRGQREKEIPISEFSSGSEESIPIFPFPTTPAVENISGDKAFQNEPFILHKEKTSAPVGEDKKSIFKSISIPLGFFKPKNQSLFQPAKPMRVEIETPNKDEKRVVNYSELRTSLSPFEGGQNFINLGNLEGEKKSAIVPEIKNNIPEIPRPPKLKPAAEKKSVERISNGVNILGTIKKPQPRVEGNIIDLR